MYLPPISDRPPRDRKKESESFISLSPKQQMQVLIEDIADRGRLRESDFRFWREHQEEYREKISFSDRAKGLSLMTGSKKAAKNIGLFFRCGLFEFCLWEYFPLRRIASNDLKRIVSHLEYAQRDKAMQTALILFPFRGPAAAEIVGAAELLPLEREKILFALEKIDDYLLIKYPHLLKAFILENGWEKYRFIKDFSDILIRMLDIPEYKQRTKEFMLSEIRRRKEPILKEDMKIGEKELVSEGIDQEKIEFILDVLIRHLHKYPSDNREDLLLKMAKRMQGSRIYTFCIEKGVFKIR